VHGDISLTRRSPGAGVRGWRLTVRGEANVRTPVTLLHDVVVKPFPVRNETTALQNSASVFAFTYAVFSDRVRGR